jgi:outer membrane lipoprotein-sorting protein
MMSAAFLFVLATATAAAPAETPPVCPSGEAAPDVEKLVSFTERVMSGKTTTGTMAMTIKTPSFSRKLKMKLWSKGDDYALIRVVEGGPREVGMMTLKREKQLWNYLPQAARVMKLPSGMLGDSWMGSDFTNDDLVKGSSLAKDFTASVTASSDGKQWLVTLVPKASAVVVWGKIEMQLDRATCAPVEQRFYDEDGKLARKMTHANVKQVGWRKFPTKMTVTPGDGGRETTIEYEDIAFDTDVADDTFSLHRLQQGR